MHTVCAVVWSAANKKGYVPVCKAHILQQLPTRHPGLLVFLLEPLLKHIIPVQYVHVYTEGS